MAKTGEITLWPERAAKIYANIKAINNTKYISLYDGKLHGYQGF